jgi:signal transduction histidine kinase
MDMGADRIQNIVVSLRNFSRLDEPNMAVVDIHEGLEGTLMILHPRLGATALRPAIRLTRDYGSDVPPVECYAGQLNQVLMNLIVNAVDAIDEACERADFEANQAQQYQIKIATANEPAHHITIRVIDNGPGMPADTQAKIFDAFFTTKPVGQGTGLGLSISHQIVTEKHRGQIFCRSELGKGTAFVLQIPQRQGPVSDN